MIGLDTNAVIGAIGQRAPHVRARLEQALTQEIAVGIPAIVLYELWYGIRKSARPQRNAKVLTTFLALNITPWPFEPEDAAEAGDIRAALERAGQPIGPYDVLIAAQARRRGALLVTANGSEFSRVDGLSWTDWSRAP